MGGADAAGIVTFSENGDHDQERARYEHVRVRLSGGRSERRVPECVYPHGGRSDARCTRPVRRRPGGVGCTVSGLPTFNFTNPVNGSPVTAQRVVPGVDAATGGGTTNHPNYAYGADPSTLRVLGFDNLKGDELVNRHERSAERRLRPAGGHVGSVVAGERQGDAEVHLRLLVVLLRSQHRRRSDEQPGIRQPVLCQPGSGIRVARTAGLLRRATTVVDDVGPVLLRLEDHAARQLLRQPVSARPAVFDSRYANPFPYAAPGRRALRASVRCRRCSCSRRSSRHDATYNIGQAPGNCIPGLFAVAKSNYCFGSWQGGLNSASRTRTRSVAGADLQYQTRSERESFAVYTQGVYTFNEHFALTLGARWARDQLNGEENLRSTTKTTSFRWASARRAARRVCRRSTRRSVTWAVPDAVWCRRTRRVQARRRDRS